MSDQASGAEPTGPVAIVTGAAGSIGRATCLRLGRSAAARGHALRLLVTDRDEDGLQGCLAELDAAGVAAEGLAGDIADPALPGLLVAEALGRFGRLDILVSNAGMSRRGLLSQQTVEDWDRVFAVNARATWLLAQAAFTPLRESGGALVAVASIAGISPNPGTGFYSASKAALIGLVTQLALEWAGSGIRVNMVSPGVTMTGMIAARYADAPGLRTAREAMIPLSRFAEPEEIAAVIDFLAGPESRFCHGQNVVVDGGLLPSVLQHALPPVRRG
jgi:glucose 1-dehydrogenase